MSKLAYLLDTNVVSEPMKKQGDAKVIERILTYESEIAIASWTWHELWYGVHRLPDGKRKDTLSRFLEDVVSRIPVFDYCVHAAKWHAEVRAKLEKDGISTAIVDGQIAATAKIHDLILVTRNVKDFEAFGIEIQDWGQT